MYDLINSFGCCNDDIDFRIWLNEIFRANSYIKCLTCITMLICYLYKKQLYIEEEEEEEVTVLVRIRWKLK